MHIVGIVIAMLSAFFAALAVIDGVLFLLRLHGPFTVSGEALQYAFSFGSRKPRFVGRLRVDPLRLPGREFLSLLKSAAIGLVFWLVVAISALIIHGPIKPIHEW